MHLTRFLFEQCISKQGLCDGTAAALLLVCMLQLCVPGAEKTMKQDYVSKEREVWCLVGGKLRLRENGQNEATCKRFVL